MAKPSNTAARVNEGIADALRSVRFAGRNLIVPSHADAGAVRALTEQGLARSHLGHIVLTPKGRQQFREQMPMLVSRG